MQPENSGAKTVGACGEPAKRVAATVEPRAKIQRYWDVINCNAKFGTKDRAFELTVEAIEFHRRARLPVSTRSQLVANQGWILLAQNRHELALKYFSQSERLAAPSDPKILFTMRGSVRCLTELKRYAEADRKIRDARAHLRRIPGAATRDEIQKALAEFQMMRAGLQIAQARPLKALEFMTSAYSESSENEPYANSIRESRAEVQNKVGWTAFNRKDHQSARNFFLKTLALAPVAKPHMESAHFGLLKIGRLHKDARLMAASLDALIDLVPANTLVRSEFIHERFTLKLEDALEKAQGRVEIGKLLKTAREEFHFDQTIALNRHVWRLARLAWKSFGDTGIADLERALTIQETGSDQKLRNEDRIFSLFIMGLVHLEGESYGAARSSFDAILALDSRSVAAHAGLENLAIVERDYVPVIRSYLKANEIIGNRWFACLQDPLIRLGEHVSRNGTRSQVILLTKLIEPMVPNHRNILFSVAGFFYYNHGNYEEAKRMFHQARASEPERDVAHPEWPNIGLAIVAVREKDILTARREFDLALKIRPESTRALGEAAEFYEEFDFARAKSLNLAILTITRGENLEAEQESHYRDSELAAIARLRLVRIAAREKNKPELKRQYNELRKLNVEPYVGEARKILLTGVGTEK